jgi:putative endonuclease
MYVIARRTPATGKQSNLNNSPVKVLPDTPPKSYHFFIYYAIILYMKKTMFIYILTNKSNTVFYVGVTNNLIRRIREHKNHSAESFTSKYNITKLVYYEVCSDPIVAITREKQLKGGNRANKLCLIQGMNPLFKDLYKEVCY